MQVRLAAQPDIVTIEPATRRLIGALFDCVEFGTIDSGDHGDPMQVWQVLGESVVGEPLRGFARFGAEPAGWQPRRSNCYCAAGHRAKAGDGRWCWFPVEAGLGKSRSDRGVGGAPAGRTVFSTALFLLAPPPGQRTLSIRRPARARIRDLSRDDLPASRLEKLDILLGHAGMADEDGTIPGRSAGVAGAGAPRAAEPRSTTEKQRTLEALNAQIEGLARQQPVVVVLTRMPIGSTRLRREVARHHRRTRTRASRCC